MTRRSKAQLKKQLRDKSLHWDIINWARNQKKFENWCLAIPALEPQQQSEIDARLAHKRETEQLKTRSKETCKLFRCIKCWKYIFVDDSIVPVRDGYVHKVCINF
jgi:hypothetical protein